MKILILHNLYGRLKRGGAETVIEELAQGLLSLGHEVAVISGAPQPKRGETLTEGIRHYEIKSSYYDLAKFPTWRRLAWHLQQFIAIKKYKMIRQITKRYQPDLILTNNLMGLGWLTPLSLLIAKVPIIHTIHDVQLVYPSGLLYYGKEKNLELPALRLYRSAVSFLMAPIGAVISPSRWLLDLHRRYSLFTERPGLVLANPMADLPIPPQKEGDKRELRLLFAGQWEEHKGIGMMLEALGQADWKDMLQGTPFSRVKLEIAGSGTLQRSIEGYRSDSQAFDIEILGRLDHSRLLKRMQANDILLFPSLCYENSPMAIREALAAGMRVVASRLGGIPELLPKESLFEPGQVASFLACLKASISKGPGPMAKPSLDGISYARKVIDFSKTLL